MAYDERFADRIRLVSEGTPGLTERKMFGGLAFLVNGHMACGPVNDVLMVRVGPDDYEVALTRPEANELTFTNRPMRGVVEVGIESLDDDKLLAEWVNQGISFALSLPAEVAPVTYERQRSRTDAPRSAGFRRRTTVRACDELVLEFELEGERRADPASVAIETRDRRFTCFVAIDPHGEPDWYAVGRELAQHVDVGFVGDQFGIILRETPQGRRQITRS